MTSKTDRINSELASFVSLASVPRASVSLPAPGFRAGRGRAIADRVRERLAAEQAGLDRDATDVGRAVRDAMAACHLSHLIQETLLG